MGGMVKIGYARASPLEESLDTQLEALHAAGCDEIYADESTGTPQNRDQFRAVREILQAGDVLVVTRLDRLGRSIPDLVRLLAELHERGVQLQSLEDDIDTTAPHGKMLRKFLSALRSYERALSEERAAAARAAARARGRKGGRPARWSEEERARIRQMYREGVSAHEIMASFPGLSRASIYRFLERS